MNIDINTLKPIMSVVLPPLDLVFEETATELKTLRITTRDGWDGDFPILASPGIAHIALPDLSTDLLYAPRVEPSNIEYPSLPSQTSYTGGVDEQVVNPFLASETPFSEKSGKRVFEAEKGVFDLRGLTDFSEKGVSEVSDLEKGVNDAPSDLEKGVSKESAVDLEADWRVTELLKLNSSWPLVEADPSDHPQGLDISHLYGNAILFGHDPCARIVAVEFSPPNIAVEYLRDDNGTTSNRITQFNPFLWDEMAGDRSLLESRRFSCWGAMLACCHRQRNQRVFRDPKQQYLTASGRTLFKGMKFDELRRLQLDIETSCASGYEMSNPERDHILAIAISDSTGWEKLLDSPEEGTMLRELSAIIAERDPDVVEGHNIFGFDLPFILSRAARLRVPLPWGRDGSPVYRPLNYNGEPTTRTVNIAGSARDVPDFRIHGRHIVDTMILAALYDTSTRHLPDLKLKSVAASLGVRESGRVILQGDDIQRTYYEDRDSFISCALGDVRETRAISAILSQSYFIQAQMFPLSYQDVILVGTATKVNTLLLREYLRAGQPIPISPPKRDYRGALCELHCRGVIRDVWHCDVSSLYPTIMLLFECLPKSDTLNVLRTALTDLRNYRLRTKRLAETTEDPQTKALLNTLQGAFKILINSGYGYLGCSGMNFADYDVAEMVTAIGRNIISRMRDWLIAHGCVVIELDTDGIYFHKPADIDIEKLSRGLTESLPCGIEVSFDRHYSAMFSYEEKNHALLNAQGQIIIKGSALRSRSRERYLSIYQDAVLAMLLHSREAEVPVLFSNAVTSLHNQTIPFKELMRTEELHETIDDYNRRVNSGERKRAGAYEAIIASGKAFGRGDRVSFYYRRREPGEKKRDAIYKRAKLAPDGEPLERDEDIELYLNKLQEVAKQFDEFAPRELNKI